MFCWPIRVNHRRHACSRKTLRYEPLEERHYLTVITFESLRAPAQPAGTSLSIDGFDIAVRGSVATAVHAPGSCSPDCPENGGQYLRTQLDGVLTFSEENNRPFALHSLQVAESFEGVPSFWAARIDIKGILTDGKTVDTSVELDGVQDGFGPMDDFQTFVLPDAFEEIVAFQLSGSGGFSRNDFSIDNVEVSTLPDDSDPSAGDFDRLDFTPSQAIAALVTKVNDLELHRGIGRNLIKKLEGARNKIDDGNAKNDNAAIGKLNAFVRQVRAQSGKKIGADDAGDLIADASSIITFLN